MKIFLVGGCIRDVLLGLEPSDHDFVVVGSSPEEMESQGFTQVGADFPVFLHPTTGDEFSLARTERKTGRGYHGFVTDFSKDVTIEDDLYRRDITINALAQEISLSKNGTFEIIGDVIDPYNGRDDLELGILRHVSSAFAEDPVRILRVARFAARFGFKVASETTSLMQEMVNAGEVNELTPERVWQELNKTLGENTPHRFFEVLRTCGALKIVFPELDCLWGVPQPPQWHPEVDTGVHTMLVLQQVCLLSDNKVTRFAALVHDLGKGITPKDKLPSHPGHEELGVPIVKALCERLKVPTEFQNLAVKVCRSHLIVHKASEIRAGTLIKVLESLDVIRQPHILKMFLDAVEADARGRTGLENRPYPQRQLFEAAAEAMRSVKAKEFIDRGFKGKQIGDLMRQKQIMGIKRVINRIKKGLAK